MFANVSKTSVVGYAPLTTRERNSDWSFVAVRLLRTVPVKKGASQAERAYAAVLLMVKSAGQDSGV